MENILNERSKKGCCCISLTLHSTFVRLKSIEIGIEQRHQSFISIKINSIHLMAKLISFYPIAITATIFFFFIIIIIVKHSSAAFVTL
jgi:hypothetical protein